MDVVTANKGPIAWNWRRVAAAADAAGRRIRFESTVMDGLPVFSLLEFALPDCRLLGFEAVFNATTNYIVDAMGIGRSFDEALAHVQAEGYAEADPAHDIDGWDAACKAAALANVAMDAGITPADIDKQSLRDVPLERIAQARSNGNRLRLVTTVWREESGRVRGRVRATELDIDHPLAPVGGESLGAILHTDLMADVFVCEIARARAADRVRRVRRPAAPVPEPLTRRRLSRLPRRAWPRRSARTPRPRRTRRRRAPCSSPRSSCSSGSPSAPPASSWSAARPRGAPRSRARRAGGASPRRIACRSAPWRSAATTSRGERPVDHRSWTCAPGA